MDADKSLSARKKNGVSAVDRRKQKYYSHCRETERKIQLSLLFESYCCRNVRLYCS